MTIDALRAGAAGTDTVLEALRATLVSLGKHPFDFEDWSKCTCGHIYRGALGRGTRDEYKVLGSEDARFAAVLQAVVDAHGLRVFEDGLWVFEDGIRALRAAVSDATIFRASDESDKAMRAAAIELIEGAIAFEEARNEEARLALVASRAAAVSHD